MGEELIDVLDSNYPLMVLLREKAPGTFGHSKNVASMLETIAPELKLDAKKLKIAAYYHDIGKTCCPQYFIENQTDENIHKYLDPFISYRIITAHIGDTVQILVNDPNISRDVIEWCSQHHGTSCVRYFCNKSESKNIENFRYRCTRPRYIESALLMLCDHLEARSKSLIQANKLNSTDTLVEQVIDELLEDEQLDDVAMPKLGYLRIIKSLLKRELSSQYHKRVDYDKADEDKSGR